jgi:2-dehydropantoate 2-reductase
MAQAKIAAGQIPHKMSLWIDVEQNRPIEVEVIVGEVVRLAKEFGVEVPRLEVVEALMRGLQADIMARRGSNQ